MATTRKRSPAKKKVAKRKGPARGAKAGRRSAGTRRPSRTAAKGAVARRRPARRSPSVPMPEALLSAARAADVVEVPARTVLAIDGAGGPEQEAFGRAVGALFGVAYTLKFSRKGAGGDFKIGPLEGRWWAEGAADGAFVAPREAWRWRLRLAVPDGVDEHEVADVIQAATMKKGGKLEGSAEARRVTVERVAAQTMGRALHVGPYSEEGASFARIRDAIAAAGKVAGRPHLEIYLTDPRRTPPARLRTALLLEATG